MAGSLLKSGGSHALFSFTAFGISNFAGVGFVDKKLPVEVNSPSDFVDLITLVRASEIVTEINGDVSRSDTLGKNEFYGFGLRLVGLDAGIANIRNLDLGPVKLLRAFFVGCLRMIMSRLDADFFPLRCLCGHFQDHSVVGRSPVGNPVSGS